MAKEISYNLEARNALKAGVDKAAKFRHAPAVMRYTCDLCATLLEPLAVAEALATRQRSLRIVGPALLLCQATVARCNALVTEPDDDSEAGWKEYLSARTEGVSKYDRLKDMQEQLSRATAALQLVLVDADRRPHEPAALPRPVLVAVHGLLRALESVHVGPHAVDDGGASPSWLLVLWVSLLR